MIWPIVIFSENLLKVFFSTLKTIEILILTWDIVFVFCCPNTHDQKQLEEGRVYLADREDKVETKSRALRQKPLKNMA